MVWESCVGSISEPNTGKRSFVVAFFSITKGCWSPRALVFWRFLREGAQANERAEVRLLRFDELSSFSLTGVRQIEATSWTWAELKTERRIYGATFYLIWFAGACVAIGMNLRSGRLAVAAPRRRV
jgi:hypothetical protein